MQKYQLIDSGAGRKLERFGPFVISRPCSQAIWKPQLSEQEWQNADATFTREGDNKWIFRNPKAQSPWSVELSGLQFKIAPTDFGHLGIFPEHSTFWDWMQKTFIDAKKERNEPVSLLNLFAYSGGATLAAAKAGAHVCHLDASKGMVAWARENAALNGLEGSPVRWIVEDVRKFLMRELRRGKRYDGIILDPPSFGRGSQGEVFKIEEHILEILSLCRSLFTEKPLFLLFSCHTPGFTPIAMRHLLLQMMEGCGGTFDEGEMLITGEKNVWPIPSGTYARWVR